MEEFNDLAQRASTQELTPAEVAKINHFTSSFRNLDRLLGVSFRTAGPQGVTLELNVTTDHIQPFGVTNGGVYASLGETAASMAGYLAAGAGPLVMGTNNNTDFLRPSKPGDVIVSTAVPVHLGRTSQLWRVEHVNEENGKTLAITTLKTTVMPRER